ncbi:MAG: cytochrome-c oxidase, cbb3-type subunit III [Rhodospirillaceae bacterium]|nr:cytochrome-c oxidase, cbb3-type subunit III [Rhodospirillaceae bacterium]|tara:strand:- start:130 stop:999 length:870 start_codon:yes stop_codon:yes gene_type:complete
MSERHTDDFTGVETTGHEWDGIRELDNPLPRWWQWIFWACVVWSIGYWIVYPAWPLVSGYTKGMFGYSSRGEVAKEIAKAETGMEGQLEQIRQASLEQIRTNANLREFALAGGRSAFAVNCSQCHGSGAQGFKGYPNLNDDEWIWGGTIDAIAYTITHGIRNTEDEDARQSDMPAFGRDGILEKAQINDVAEYVLSMSGQSSDASAAARGKPLFTDNCAACHGENGGGSHEFGAPALNNDLWLYGGDKATIVETISKSRRGVMPAWGKHLDDATVKQLAIYVHSLGGGK